MTRFTALLFCFIQLLFLPLAKAEDRCLAILEPIRTASQRYLAEDFPYWYNLATAKKETKCRWLTSTDGHGSIGYFQLTPKILDPYLRPLFPDYDKPYSKDHFFAFAYYLGTLIRSNPVQKLWLAYQRYNGGDWVLRECKLAGSFDWKLCRQACFNCRALGGKRCRNKVCVWKTASSCKQYRHACDINYSYSAIIYQEAQSYRKGSDARWRFW